MENVSRDKAQTACKWHTKPARFRRRLLLRQHHSRHARSDFELMISYPKLFFFSSDLSRSAGHGQFGFLGVRFDVHIASLSRDERAGLLRSPTLQQNVGGENMCETKFQSLFLVWQCRHRVLHPIRRRRFRARRARH